MAAAAGLLVDELAEVMADFPSFCSLLEIRTKRDGVQRFDYSKWNWEQRRFELDRTGFDIVIKPRQIGFSTLEIARDLHHAITRPGENVQVVVHDADIKEQLFLTLRTMAERLHSLGLLPSTRYSTKTELVFHKINSAVRIVEAGATVKAAAKKGRSGTIHRLHATEVAFWGEAHETWTSLGAAAELAREIVIESTANGAGGLFYEMVQAAKQRRGQYKLHFFPWYKHHDYKVPCHSGFDAAPQNKWERKLREAGCNDQQIAWWRQKVDSPEWGLDKTLQEYPVDVDSAFRVHGRQFFSPDEIDALKERVWPGPARVVVLRRNGRTLGELRVYEAADPSAEYIVAGDVAEGTGNDASASTVLERRSGRTVATFWSDSIEPGDFGLAMAEIGWLYNTAMLAPERNNHGHATIRAIVHEAGYPVGRVYRTADDKLGWSTDAVTRPVMIDDLGAAIRTLIASTPDDGTAEECKTLIRNDKGKVEARDKHKKGGSKDDRFISWCIGWQVRANPTQEITPFNLPGL